MSKMRYVRFLVALAAVAVVFACMQFHGVAIGSLCMLCPVGFASVSAASGSVPWALVPGVAAALAIVLIAGRAFCSWLCPTGALKNLFGGRNPRGIAGQAGKSASSGCAGPCASGGGLKTQGIVLAVLLAVSFLVHFPVFCLICPIGLALGTVYALSRAFVLWQPGWELVAFPLMLLAEVFLFKRWCSSICPWGFFLGLVAKVRTRLGFALAPRSRAEACRASQGCGACSVACPEDIDVSSADLKTLEGCTLCLDCVAACPSKAITLGVAKKTGGGIAASDAHPQAGGARKEHATRKMRCGEAQEEPSQEDARATSVPMSGAAARQKAEGRGEDA